MAPRGIAQGHGEDGIFRSPDRVSTCPWQPGKRGPPAADPDNERQDEDERHFRIQTESRGAALTEYAILLALLTALLVGILAATGLTVSDTFDQVGELSDPGSRADPEATPGAHAFDRDVSMWDVSAVEDLESMFNGAASFNRDLSAWTVVLPAATCAEDEATRLFALNADAWTLPKPDFAACAAR